MNIWTKFNGLIPKTPLSIGTIVALSGNTATVELLDGGTITAIMSCSLTIGSMVYVKDGVVQGEAPNLPTYHVEIY